MAGSWIWPFFTAGFEIWLNFKAGFGISDMQRDRDNASFDGGIQDFGCFQKPGLKPEKNLHHTYNYVIRYRLTL